MKFWMITGTENCLFLLIQCACLAMSIPRAEMSPLCRKGRAGKAALRECTVSRVIPPHSPVCIIQVSPEGRQRLAVQAGQMAVFASS